MGCWELLTEFLYSFPEFLIEDQLGLPEQYIEPLTIVIWLTVVNLGVMVVNHWKKN